MHKAIGVSNIRLRMRVLACPAGTVDVTYSYFQDHDKAGPIELSVNFLTSVNSRLHNTKTYFDVPDKVIIIRRRLPFKCIVGRPDDIALICLLHF